jgi:hypothetical protein
MTRLLVSIVPRPHPYRTDDGRWDNELWGQVTIETEAGEQLVDTQWDPADFLEWFAPNKDAIFSDRLSIEGDGPMPGESLAATLDRLQRALGELVDTNQEAAERRYELIAQYRLRHQMSVGFPGGLVAPWIVGINDDHGEISLNFGPQVAYEIDVAALLDAICSAGTEFLSASLRESLPNDATIRARRVLGDLEESCGTARGRGLTS